MNPALRGSIAVLLLRLITGVAFVVHGWPKIQNPLHWMDAFPGHPPSFVQVLPAIAEFGGGLGLILGLLTPLCCAGIICTMLVATYTHVAQGHPFVGQTGSYELALVYLTIAMSLILTGPGRYSLDNRLMGLRRNPNDY
ncbi:MAG TPA: DoxX family protein [Polyangiales bacterium]|nr:DoxX family protein [Polyangiales bacterium]